MTEPSRFTWTGTPAQGGQIGGQYIANLRRQNEGHDHVIAKPELLKAVRSRILAATFAREILPETATLGEILALAEWLMGGTGEQFADLGPL